MSVNIKKINDLIYEMDKDFERFPLPIEFDEAEELKKLYARSMKIRAIAERYYSLYIKKR